MYDLKFLQSTISLLEDQLVDLSLWSCHNDDKFNEEIADITNAVDGLKIKIGISDDGSGAVSKNELLAVCPKCGHQETRKGFN